MTSSRRPPILSYALSVTLLATLADHGAATAVHAVTGAVSALLLALHVRHHGRWLAGVLRRVTSGRVPRRAAVDLALALAVLAAAATTTATGLLALAGPAPAAGAHAPAAAALVVLACLHAGRHLLRRARRRRDRGVARGPGAGRVTARR